MLKNGLYEQVINREIERELDSPDIVSATEPIDSAESSVVLAKYLSDVIRQGLDNISDNGGSIDNKIEFVNKIVNAVASETDDDNFNEQSVSQKAEQLLVVYEKRNSILAVDEKTAYPLCEKAEKRDLFELILYNKVCGLGKIIICKHDIKIALVVSRE